ncbi:UDP-4-amino-4,6-dideoxy-N-acetyl-beta-L-altrosamine transaminase [Chitinilyticum piscinae]|uniref:UDP-4-amino-4, 6-dideoxy-N-acetyl-beta-L-altrosamine transaminase n=1 Tax=Chitinilyticum piscinae TaxID=2866724 RepID=A0A8J7FGN8_9NEIS|nr:UDP-4-amino-4,6-dideoxy-N-acetyl-beta-L-altrosamine transaminase [Chitinilyticum piscinae]MBE9608815.1 UDP-4-amino-4,6-dideoxy-N-acetyl-beta-L-altrosamine transaminase [Chitinilyticum piscinae]
MIPYGRQQISEEDIAAVEAVLRSDWLTQGPAVPAFEVALSERTGATHAVAVSSATAALHLACLVAGVGEGDRVWTSPNTFVASANCARYCGACVDFIDIDPDTLNIDIGLLARRLAVAAQSDALPKVVIPVAFAGRSADMQALHSLARQYGFVVIEDASHAVGASYLGQPVASGEYADMTVFSFHPVKIITTAEGGAVLTNRREWADQLQRLRSHGITRDPVLMHSASEGDWYYQMLELGFNYRMTDLQAALGLSQLQRLDVFLERRRQLACRYAAQLAELPLILPSPSEESAWHLYVVQLVDASRRKAIFNELRARGIGVNVHYIPVHLQPYYQAQGFTRGYCPVAEAYYQRAITLPLHAGMTDAQQDEVVSVLKELLQ